MGSQHRPNGLGEIGRMGSQDRPNGLECWPNGLEKNTWPNGLEILKFQKHCKNSWKCTNLPIQPMSHRPNGLEREELGSG